MSCSSPEVLIMARGTYAIETGRSTLSHSWLSRSSRSIQVRVVDGAREVDRFQSSSPELLRAALRPIYRNRGRAVVQFLGIEEEWLLPGIRRGRREVELANFGAALMFLVG